MDDKEFELDHRRLDKDAVNNADAPETTFTVMQPNQTGGMELYDWIQCFIAAIVIGIVLFVFVGRIIGIDGSSMLNTLRNDDKVVLSNLFFTPHYGDIVVVKIPNEVKPLVKRVIAVGGDTIDIDFITGDVTINGQLIDESYIREPTLTREDFDGPITIPEGYIFVMGDNRNHSTDSRSSYVGIIDTRQVLGKVLLVVIPGPDDDGGRSWSRFGSVYTTG